MNKMLVARLQRIKDLYAWGDLDKHEYRTQRDAIQTELRIGACRCT